MMRITRYRKPLFAVAFLLTVNFVFGASSGNNLTDNNKYSLKNLNNRTYKDYYSLNSLKSGTYLYKGSSDLSQQNTGGQIKVESMIRLEKGNTTYVYPYKYTVKVPKFKTPEAPMIR